MKLRKDLTGLTFNHLTVIEFSHQDKSKKSYWKCKCSCGKHTVVQGHKLTSGRTKTCGCIHGTKIDLSFTVQGAWTVFEEVPERNKHGQVMFRCVCKCGKEKIIAGNTLKYGKKLGCRSCAKTTNGRSKSPLGSMYGSMRSRCYNPSDKDYHLYGGRGITICEEWNDFKAFEDWMFSNGYHKGLQIDRINNNGNYEPSNCRLTTSKENNRNKRSNVTITYLGKTMCATAWEEELGLTRNTLYAGLKRGQTIAQIHRKSLRER